VAASTEGRRKNFGERGRRGAQHVNLRRGLEPQGRKRERADGALKKTFYNTDFILESFSFNR
jgi:hypothetical protein